MTANNKDNETEDDGLSTWVIVDITDRHNVYERGDFTGTLAAVKNVARVMAENGAVVVIMRSEHDEENRRDLEKIRRDFEQNRGDKLPRRR